MVGPQAKREAIDFLISNKKFSAHRAYKLVGLRASTFYYKKTCTRDDAQLQAKLVEIAQKRIRWGCPRIYEIARREGFKDNYKRVERIYREMGLSLRKRPKKKSEGICDSCYPSHKNPTIFGRWTL